MKLLGNKAAVRDFLTRQEKPIALVPTMGALHRGHRSLIDAARERSEQVVVTIFVNPTQFAPTEDLARYPRTPEADLQLCKEAGVAAVYAPEAHEVYPKNHQTWVEVEGLSRGLCALSRPGHFRGVATIVTKLFALFRPRWAFFGEKDYQQLCIIRQLASDLDLGVEVLGAPTVREPDGLALSSRNVYLSPPDRLRALALSQGLRKAQELAANGETSVSVLVAALRAALDRVEALTEYAEVRDATTLNPLTTLGASPARALVAAHLGTTRLIDNVPLPTRASP